MWEMILNFKVIFLGVLLGALPFLLFSVIVSSIMHNLISEEFIHRILPHNKFFNLITASLLGMLFPSCDCGMVPLTRRFIHKGVPVYSAIAFMLAAPIINPMVIFSTLYAFNSWEFVIARCITAFFVAFCVGWIISVFCKKVYIKEDVLTEHDHSSCGCEHEHHHDHSHNLPHKIADILNDARMEFFDMGKFLVCGSLIGAAAQTFIPRELLLTIGHHAFAAPILMMAFAFIISVCSSADAFIAASFITSFSPEALVAFMVFGPMFDTKNTLMLSHTFRVRFVIFLIFIVSILCFIGSYVFSYRLR